MDKSILYDYIDACELIKETEEDIRNHRKREIVFDKVRGSNPEFPYQPMSFPVSGMIETPTSEDEEERLLQERKANARRIKLQVEAWMNTIPNRMQRIIKYRIFEKESWEQVAKKLGRNATGDSVKMEYRRFLEKK